jgi:hypothetical protein
MRVSGAVRDYTHSTWDSYGSSSLLKYLHLICIFVLFYGVEVLDCTLGSVIARWDAVSKGSYFSVSIWVAPVNLLVAVECVSQYLHST